MEEQSKNIKLSVIVPCYNVEPYLDRSLFSLEEQWNGRTDYEIILVNDASPDGTIHKLNAFKEKHPDNVIVIDKQQNEGPGAARNSGLEIAQGEWICMFDPDDALALGGYDYLLRNYATDDVDLVSFCVDIIPEHKAPKVWDIEVKPSGKEHAVITTEEYTLKRKIGSSICFLYRREVCGNERYPRQRLLEDVIFNMPIFLKDSNRKVVLADEKIYYYLVRPTSSTNSLDPKSTSRGCIDMVAAIKTIDEYKHNSESKAISKKLLVYQQKYTFNLVTRLLLSDLSYKDIQSIKKTLEQCECLPDSGGMKSLMYNSLIRHPSLLLAIRPFYRTYRKHRR